MVCAGVSIRSPIHLTLLWGGERKSGLYTAVDNDNRPNLTYVTVSGLRVLPAINADILSNLPSCMVIILNLFFHYLILVIPQLLTFSLIFLLLLVYVDMGL
jgi:hypothetical protein